MKKMMKQGLKAMAAVFLSFAMVLGTTQLPQFTKVARAEGTAEKTITGLGTGAITNPNAPADANSSWSGSYVYYGKYNGSNPTKYRVLDKASDKFGVEGRSLFLDCDRTLYNAKFDEDGAANAGASKPNEWAYSDVKKGLNGDSFLTKSNNFTAAESSAIADSRVGTHALIEGDQAGQVCGWTKGAFKNYTALEGEKIFLLDVEDASNIAYGYSAEDGDAANKKKSGSDTYWWLRSPCDNSVTGAGNVDPGGGVALSDVDDQNNILGVSPAFNVNLSSVIFSSLISGTAGQPGAEYKLTLADSDMTIAVTNGNKVSRNKNTVTVPYTISGDDVANAGRVSVLITDSAYTAGTAATSGYTYLKLSVDSWGSSGTGTFILPDAYADKACGTDYHVYILAEDANEGKETDYASTPAEITIPVLPAITAQPEDLALTYGYDSGALSITAAAAGGHTLSYQWYKNTTDSNVGGEAIEGASSASYTIPAGKAVGTAEYYYCVVTDTDALPQVTSDVVVVTVGKADIPAESITPPTAKTGLKYTGLAQKLINAGSVAVGISTMQYALGSESAATEAYTESIPSKTEVGTYYVWYKAVGGSNYNDTDPAGPIQVEIGRAAMPQAPSEITRKYPYFRNNSDRLTLTGLPGNCGTVSWNAPTASGSLIFTEGPAVTQEGVLSYTVAEGAKGSKGTITVKAGMRNYEDVTFTISLELVDQTPVKLKEGSSVTLQSSTLTYGQALSELKFNPAVFAADDAEGKTVAGTLAWKEPDTVPEAGTISPAWVFTPSDMFYASLEGTVAVTVNKADIGKADAALGAALTYNGTGQTQEVTSVSLNGTDITAYCEITDNTGTNAGDYVLTVTAKADSNYTGYVKKAFTIMPKEVSSPSVTLSGNEFVYTGEEIRPAVASVADGGTEIADTEYAVSYKDNINAGTAYVLITDEAGGNYAVNGKAGFTITKADHPQMTAEGEARYGTSGMLDLKDYIAEGGS
nr:DUF6273 domain-containing protein [Lachnospiraceae bacterium]